MSVYLKKFETTSEYEAYINGGGVVLPNVSFCEDARGMYYKPYVEPPHDYSQDYFTMVVTSSGGIKWSGSTTANALSYSKDNGNTWSAVTSTDTVSVESGDKILWKGTTTPSALKPYGIGRFNGSADVRYSVEGNAMSLLYGDNFKGQTSLEGKNYAFSNLFGDNINVISAENLLLPATILAEKCYMSMFRGCTSLTTAPESLLAKNLTAYCYSNMFKGCTSLTTAPELPAPNLIADHCYSTMFDGCTSLNSITCLAGYIITSKYCTEYWVRDVAASGIFTKAASMSSWTTGVNGIPNGWTVVNA